MTLRKFRDVFLKNTTPRLTIVKNFLWLLFSNGSSRLLKGLIIVYAARKLGASEYGVFSYALALASFFVFFKNVGVDAVLTREVAKRPEQQQNFFSTSFWIEIGLLIVTVGLILGIAPLFSASVAATALLPWITLLLLSDDLKDLLVAFFRGKERMELEAIVLATSNIALVVLAFLFLTVSVSAQSFALSYVGSSFIGLALAFWFLRTLFGEIFSNFNPKLIGFILNSAWPFALGGVISVFLFNVDVIMLGWWRSISEVGLYSAAQRMVGILSVPSGLIATVTFPTLSRFIHQGDQEKAKTLLENILHIIFVLALPLAVGGFVLKASLMPFIFGREYGKAGTAMGILLFSVFATHSVSIFSNILFAFDKQRRQIAIVFISSIVSVLLNIFLIRSYGIEGAALATTLTAILFTSLLWYVAKKLVYFEILKKLPGTILAAILMGVCASALERISIPLLVNIAISGFLYFGLLYVLREKILWEIMDIGRQLVYK